MGSFAGFDKRTSKFLRGLGRNNSKAWFEAHRSDYEAHYLAPAIAFVEDMGERLVKIAPEVRAEPRVNGSIFRINRDVRFSKDKTPYKDHIDMRFWEGPDRKSAVSGFFLRIRSDRMEIGAGAHQFDRDLLAAYRSRVAGDRAAGALSKVGAKVQRAGFPLQGESYKKLPKGVEPISEERDRLMRHSALWCSTAEPLPDEFGSRAFIGYCAAIWRKMLPVHRWLVDELQ